MAKYISNRQQNLKIGIVSYTENQQVLEVTGNVGIKTSDTQDYELYVAGDANISGIVSSSVYYGNQVIGTPTGGFKTGAVGIITSDFTKNSINDINFILGKLVPKPPTTINGQTLTNTVSTTAKICNFTFTNNTGDTSPAAGSDLVRITTNTVSSQYLTQFGPGDSGTVTAYVNAVGVGTTTLTADSNDGTYGSLQIANDRDAFFSTRNPGIASEFYEIYDARIISAFSPDGYNKSYIEHVDGASIYETTSFYWYEDNSTVTTPVLSVGSTTIPSSPVVSYSSGVPHYTQSASNAFTYVITCQNASGDMYTTNTFMTSGGQTTGFQNGGNKSYTDFNGGTNPPVNNYGVGTGVTCLISQTPRDIHDTVSTDSTKFSLYTATTPYGTTTVRATISQSVNIMGTTSTTSKIDEDNILISSLGTGSGNAVRVNSGSGIDNPTPIYTSWNPDVSAGSSETIVRGGVLRHDQTNYSTGNLPVGPDYSSGRSGSQYFQVQIIRSNVSQFKISVTGTYAGCFICMPDNSTWTTSLSGTNGWANMFQAYRGSGVPTSAEPGCSSGGVMTGLSGTFTCVFGTESSSNDTNNRILVRFKLNSGQSITSLSFSS
jgi:hypothetical protein